MSFYRFFRSFLIITDLILSRKAEDKISGLFIDPTGQHVIVSCSRYMLVYFVCQISSGNSFYLLAKFNKFVPLPKLKGINIISVAWDKKATESKYLFDYFWISFLQYEKNIARKRCWCNL